MIGNDIVDLKLAFHSPKSGNLRYLSKICCQSEIITINESDNPELTLWRVWSMKESAYKIIAKKSGINLFIPKKIKTEILDDTEGRVLSEWGEFICKTQCCDSFIHSVAIDDYSKSFQAVKEYSENNQSIAVREFFISEISKLLQDKYSTEFFTVEHQDRIPYLHYKKKPMNADMSMSHHGSWISWAFQIYEKL